MGTDMAGWVEYAQPNNRGSIYWSVAFELGSIPGRNYGMYGSLFGVRNFAHFHPIAPSRGIPYDASWQVRHDWGIASEDDFYTQDNLNATAITWQEIKSIDWEEEAEEIDDRSFYQYQRDIDGQLIHEEIINNHLPWNGKDVLRNGGLWENGTFVYKGRKLKRKNVLGKDWQLLFSIMELVAQEYGNECVRLIVWFCS